MNIIECFPNCLLLYWDKRLLVNYTLRPIGGFQKFSFTSLSPLHFIISSHGVFQVSGILV